MTPTIPMPGALRWREMYPLIDGDGSCSLIYDLERAAVLEVPEDLRFYVAPALETGDLDDGLLSWLVQEDLLTAESQAGWGGGGAAGRLAVTSYQETSLQLSIEVRQITPSLAASLASVPLRVQVLCEPFPPRADAVELRIWETSASSLLLMAPLADRVTVSCVLSGGARLLDLWDWARRLRVRHLDATRLAGGSLREYRHDLLAVCDEMASELEARRSPIDFRPVTRIVRRLMRSEPLDRLSSGGGFAWAAGSEPYPGLEGVPPETWDETEDEPCPRCWARNICNHSSLLASPSCDRQTPGGERCAIWLTEAEAALRLYHRFAHCDPISVVRFIEAPGQLPSDSFRRGDLEAPKLPC